MTNRARSLATRVTTSLTTIQQLSSSATANKNNEEMIDKEPSLKRVDSFTSQIHHFTITSPIKHHSPDEYVSSLESPQSDMDVDQEKDIVFANETETNQYSTFDVKHSQLRITVLGPGGVTIPEVDRLRHLIPNGTITVMCLTWNVASRSQNHLSKIEKLITSEQSADRADLICLCFQELPSINAYYHQETVKSLATAVADTHLVFCWVRKWSQMVTVFIREPLIAYTSSLCHSDCQACSNERSDWRLLSNFSSIGHFRNLSHDSTEKDDTLSCSGVKQADCVGFELKSLYRTNEVETSILCRCLVIFWFGDLNFRLRNRERVDALDSQNKKQEDINDSYFDQLLIDDELTLERLKGNVFEGFSEAYINFPPTHKFVLGTNDYVSNRIPSYTDRILYYAKEPSRIKPEKYDCLWEENASDHKPVYGFYYACFGTTVLV
ncbi:hypothetical protein DINM_021625 [Dirofilaria immitis]|nr:hypothetical protein [Dirofilaria immitis]